MSGSPWNGPLVVFVFAALLYLCGNGSTTLWDRDEPQYVEAAREMVATGHYLVPTLFGRPYLDKPILAFWLIAVAGRSFGFGEFAVRLFPALFGAASSAVTAALGERLFGRRVGLLAGLILTTSPEMAFVAKAAVTDAPLVFFVALAMLSFVQIESGSRSRVWFFGLYGATALAALTKGVPGPVIVVATITLSLVVSRDTAVVQRLHVLAGTAVVLTVVGAWLGPATWTTSGEVLRVGLYRETLERATSAFEGHGGGVFYYPLALLAGFYPWSSFVPSALGALGGYDTDRSRWSRSKGMRHPTALAWRDRRWRLLVLWSMVTVGLFSLSSTKLPHYVLPAYPALAVLVAANLGAAMDADRPFRGRLDKLSLAILASLGLVAGATLVGAAWWIGFREVLAWSAVGGGLLAGIALAATMLCARGRVLRAIVVLGGGTYLLLFLAAALFAPELERYKISKPLADEVLARARPEDTIAVFRFREPSLRYYLGGAVRELSSAAEVDALVSGPARAWIVMPCDSARRSSLTNVLARRGFNPAKGRWIELCVVTNRRS